MSRYDEYLSRTSWGPSEALHLNVTRRLLKRIFQITGLEPEQTDFLKIGCGTGRVAKLSNDFGVRNYLGIEPTKALAEHTSKLYNVVVYPDSLPHLSCPNDSFQITYSQHVIEHAPTWKDAYEWAVEMVRVTQINGYIVICAPDVRDYKQYFWDTDWTHGFPTSPRRFSQLFADLPVEEVMTGSFRLASFSLFSAAVASLINFFIPTRIMDSFTRRISGRPLASGFKQSLTWGLSVGVFKKIQ